MHTDSLVATTALQLPFQQINLLKKSMKLKRQLHLEEIYTITYVKLKRGNLNISLAILAHEWPEANPVIYQDLNHQKVSH